MKILHVTRQFHPSIGGIEDYVLNLCIEQIKEGHNPSVFTANTNFQTDEELQAFEKIKNIPIYRKNWSFSKRYPVIWVTPYFLNQFDIIHIHAIDFFIDYISLLKKLRLIKPRIYVTTHGGFFHTPKQKILKTIFFNSITRFSLMSVDKVFTISPNDHTLFTKLKRQCKLIPNGVRLHKFGPALNSEKNEDIIYLGRFSSNKKVDWLIDSYSALEEPKGKLKLIGPSSTGDMEMLRNKIQEKKVQGQITLVLDASDEEILKHISTAKFMVSASEYEGFGLTVIELMSYGLIPLLSSKPESFVDFVKSSSLGETFSYTNLSFDKSYNTLIRNWRHGQIDQAVTYAENYSWSKIAKKITSEYVSIS